MEKFVTRRFTLNEVILLQPLSGASDLKNESEGSGGRFGVKVLAWKYIEDLTHSSNIK